MSVFEMPKKLAAFVARHPEQLDGGPDGYSDKRHMDQGMWLYLRPGWHNGDPGSHILHEDTVAELIRAFRAVGPCTCEDCEREKLRVAFPAIDVLDIGGPMIARTHDLSSHSALVRSWRPRGATLLTFTGLSTPGDGPGKWEEGESHALRSPHEGYAVRVSFAKYVAHPEWTRVRSTNWRAEYEPGGVWSTDEARRFYRALLAAGFVPETKTQGDPQ